MQTNILATLLDLPLLTSFGHSSSRMWFAQDPPLLLLSPLQQRWAEKAKEGPLSPQEGAGDSP